MHEFNCDEDYIVSDVPIPKLVKHGIAFKYLCEKFNKKGMRILEVGSRSVAHINPARKAFNEAEYIGFDYYPGDNVDVVGDAHKLSTYFENQKKFDLIYSAACFEHFAMPWIVAGEIVKLLKIGGEVFIETHFSYSAHERPWNFFQFSDMGLKVLFSNPLGIECIEAGMCNPIVARFSSLADEYLQNQPIPNLWCHSDYLGRKVKDVMDFDWNGLDLEDVVGNTKYPEPENARPKVGESVLSSKPKPENIAKEPDLSIDDLKQELILNSAKNTALIHEIESLRAENEAMYKSFVNSTSWKVTRPFRAIKRFLSR